MTDVERQAWRDAFNAEMAKPRPRRRPRPGECPTCRVAYADSLDAVACDFSHRWPPRIKSTPSEKES